MTRKVPCLIPFLFALATSSSVFFDYNKIATAMKIGMNCRVSDPEERSSITIHQGSREMVNVTSGCIIKSNDSRLSISCIETENAILISVNMSGYALSDLGTWNCSDGKSYDTVTFQNSSKNAYVVRYQLNTTFSCQVYTDCSLSLDIGIWHFRRRYSIRKIDGGVLTFIDNLEFPFLNITFLETKLSDAGIYYIWNFWGETLAFIIQVYDYPTQPVISVQNLSSISDQVLFELICSSESRTQPVFSRSRLSYHWKVNQLNPKDLYTCVRMKGPVLTLCPESCRLKDNSSISVTCTVQEDGLMSNESEPFIIRLLTPSVPVEQLVSTTQLSVSAEYTDHTGGHSTGALIGACLGCLVGGSVLSILLTLLFVRRRLLSMKDGEGERDTGDRNEAFCINSVLNSRMRTSATEITRQYEVLDQNRMENLQSQYTVILSKGSGHTNEAEIYELA